jgi:hypothetical protein
MLKNLAERQKQVPRRMKMLILWQFVLICSLYEQTELFISNKPEGTMYMNTSSYFVNYFYGDSAVF